MTGSYTQINYTLRPAKSVERKMLGEAFRCLTGFGPISSYRYVGFGSTYFSDFISFHKILGIHQMISIEKDVKNSTRFNFNRPFKCIRMKFGHSNEMLPLLDWHQKTILWLDYEDKVNEDVLTDITYFCANASAGSVIVVTVNARPVTDEEVAKRSLKDRLEYLKDSVGSDKVPSDVENKHLGVGGLARVSRRIIDNEIRQTLNDRNGERQGEAQLRYRQLFNFHYQDSSPMLTVGGLMYEEGQSYLTRSSGIDELPFIRERSKPFSIEVPKLTLREIRYLDSQLPVHPPTKLKDHSIPKKDLLHYSEIYRYFPAFVEAEL